MKNMKFYLWVNLMVCSVLLMACGNNDKTDSQKAAERGEAVVEMLLKEEDASDDEMAALRCMMDVRKKFSMVRAHLNQEQKLILKAQFELLEEPDECQKTLGILDQFAQEIESRETQAAESSEAN